MKPKSTMPNISSSSSGRTIAISMSSAPRSDAQRRRRFNVAITSRPAPRRSAGRTAAAAPCPCSRVRAGMRSQALGGPQEQQPADVGEGLAQVAARCANHEGHHAAGHGSVERGPEDGRWSKPGAERGHQLDVAAAHAAEREERQEHRQTHHRAADGEAVIPDLRAAVRAPQCQRPRPETSAHLALRLEDRSVTHAAVAMATAAASKRSWPTARGRRLPQVLCVGCPAPGRSCLPRPR